MTWDEICADPNLRDLLFRMEMNGRDQLLLTPIDACHGVRLSNVSQQLGGLLLHGRVGLACPIQTTAGVRVPDVVWTSPERRQPVILYLGTGDLRGGALPQSTTRKK